VFFVTANYNLYVYNVLWDFIQKGTFGLLFFAVVCFSPPSPKAEAVKKKAEAKNNSPDSQEPIFNFLVAAKGRSPRPRQVIRGEIFRQDIRITVFLPLER